MAQALEDMPEVVRYVKNQNLGFTIPYTLDGEEQQLHPRLPRPHRRRPRPGRPAQPDRRGVRAAEEGERQRRSRRPAPLGSGRQQPRRLRPLGVPRDRPTRGTLSTRSGRWDGRPNPPAPFPNREGGASRAAARMLRGRPRRARRVTPSRLGKREPSGQQGVRQAAAMDRARRCEGIGLTPRPPSEPGRGSKPPICPGSLGEATAIAESHPFPSREGAGG